MQCHVMPRLAEVQGYRLCATEVGATPPPPKTNKREASLEHLSNERREHTTPFQNSCVATAMFGLLHQTGVPTPVIRLETNQVCFGSLKYSPLCLPAALEKGCAKQWKRVRLPLSIRNPVCRLST